MFSITERNRRVRAAAGLMNKTGVSAVYITGNSTAGSGAHGYYRYFTGRRVYFSLSGFVLFENGELIGIAGNQTGKSSLIETSFADDAIITQDQLGGAVEILKSRGINSGRVGITAGTLPVSWLIRLREELPDVDFVDFSVPLYSIREKKSEEEIEIQRVCARIADSGYNTVCEKIKPGIFENEIVAEMERAMQLSGAEENLSLITSGKFSIGDNSLPPLHNNTVLNRKIERGDIVTVQISPRYLGYWTQLVRTVSVGEPNPDAVLLVRDVAGIIDDVKTILKAKTPVSAVAGRMRERAEAAGYHLMTPCGHITAVDLFEELLTEDSRDLLEPGMVIVIRPAIVTGGEQAVTLLGESFLLTGDGYEALTQSAGMYII